jgi:hypothetical protein
MRTGSEEHDHVIVSLPNQQPVTFVVHMAFRAIRPLPCEGVRPVPPAQFQFRLLRVLNDEAKHVLEFAQVSMFAQEPFEVPFEG